MLNLEMKQGIQSIPCTIQVGRGQKCKIWRGDKNMGIIILIIAAVIEAAFGVYCIVTKSNQKRVRSLIRIGALATFAIFMFASVIQWSFRWYLLAAILLIWTIIGGISLNAKKVDKKEYKSVRIVFKAITMWLIVVIAVTPALIFPQHKLPKMTGVYKVNTAVYTYTDKSRIETFNNKGENRKVTAQFWYPADAGVRYPLVVFSHGLFGIRASNTSTYSELASNGYIVCSIDHPYHSLYTIDTYGSFTMVDRSFMKEANDINNGVYDEETKYKLGQKFLKVRTDDMNFVLNTIIKNAKDGCAGPVYQLIDTDKIGLLGHSLGGAAGAQLGRERSDIDAVINLDGELLGEYMDFKGGKYVVNDKIYPVPILSIYTDTMKQAMARITDPNIVIPNKLITATAPNAYEVYIAGTNHMSLTDLPLISPFLVNMINGSVKNSGGGQGADKYYVIEKMNSVVLEFFNCYLKGKGSFHSAGTY
jgi:dienelactone hydrolase